MEGLEGERVHGQKCDEFRRSYPLGGVQCLGSQVLDRRAEAVLWGALRDIHRMLILFFH